MPCPHEAVMVKYEDVRNARVFYNAVAVRLPGHDAPLFLVVAKGFGKESMMLLCFGIPTFFNYAIATQETPGHK